MLDLSVLSRVVDAVKPTLTFFMLRLRAHEYDDDDYRTNVHYMRTLTQSLSQVERLEELEMRVKGAMPLGVYVK